MLVKFPGKCHRFCPAICHPWSLTQANPGPYRERSCRNASTDPESAPASLSGLPDEARSRALARFQVIRPFLEDGVPLTQIAREQGLILRTARRWVDRYRREGLAGLARKERGDKGQRKLTPTLQQLIEGLALRKPRMPTATIHREVADAARKLGQEPPSYKVVHAVVRELDPALVTLAHEGTKAYTDAFDLVHRHEATAPNAVWQADHTELDIWLKDGRRHRPTSPWLTIILDDYSRAVAGYACRSRPRRRSRRPWRCGRRSGGRAATGLAGLRHPAGALFRPRQRLHVPAPRTGGRRSQDPPDQLHASAGPAGRGKIERFFETRRPGAPPAAARLCARTRADRKAVLTLAELAGEIWSGSWSTSTNTPHTTTGSSPQDRWDGRRLPAADARVAGAARPAAADRRRRRGGCTRDGIRFSGLRYIDPTLAAYVGEEVLLRYDPRDVAEVRVFHEGRFLCRAVCQELAGETVPLREVIRAPESSPPRTPPDDRGPPAGGRFPAGSQALGCATEKTAGGSVTGGPLTHRR